MSKEEKKYSLEQLNLKWLEEKDACNGGVRWFKKEFGADTDALIVLDKLIEAELYLWANWLLTSLFSRSQILHYSLFSAELVLPIFEAKFPEDKRRRIAIEAVKKVIENDTPENRTAAANAAYAVANAAANAARASVSAANAAAYAARASVSAALAAAYAARASVSAALAAAYAADVGEETFLKILEYGKSLLQGDTEGVKQFLIGIRGY